MVVGSNVTIVCPQFYEELTLVLVVFLRIYVWGPPDSILHKLEKFVIIQATWLLESVKMKAGWRVVVVNKHNFFSNHARINLRADRAMLTSFLLVDTPGTSKIYPVRIYCIITQVDVITTYLPSLEIQLLQEIE